MTVVLVTGGTRSGKSAVAESLLGEHATYVGTATDPSMADRVAAHRARRPASWRTVEGLTLPADGDVLVDGLGTWVAGELHRAGAFDGADLDPICAAIRGRLDAFVAEAAARDGLTVVVVEQAGAAPVAPDPATRRWVDLVGEAAQRVGAVADRALLVVAGRALDLDARTHDPTPAGGRRRPVHGDRMVPAGCEDFAVNVVGDGPPGWLRDALAGALDGVGRYPDEREAVAAVAARHGCDPDQVLALNGAAEGFWLLAAALRPRRPVVVTPAFTEAATALRAHGHAAELVAEVPEDADLVLLANPANPTGALTPRAGIEAIVRPGRTVVVDEAFMDLVPGEPESLAWPHRGARPLAAREGPDPLFHRGRLVVLRSLTKSLAIPGVRAGYLLGDAGLVQRLAGVRQPWSVNAFALAALEAWAARPDATRAVAADVAARRERLLEQLRAVGVEASDDAAANFVLVRVPDGARVYRALLERRIAVRPTTDLGLDADHLRVAVRDDAANDRLVAALAEILTTQEAPA
jgi:histidinol-phosphate/aromatic aminotransferase/cobyric acid decarboxylase-like protein/adenosyl cobinamide kinase/adenosyl cobinamide phosphate guanylyltransferase